MAHDPFVRGMAIGMMRCGRSAFQAARALGVTRTTILTWWRQWNEEGNCKMKKNTGRPRCTVTRTDRKLIIAVKRHRFQPVPRLAISWIAAAGINCSVRTAYRRLAEIGLRSYRPVVRIPLTSQHKRRREDWCRERAHWTIEAWRNVLWTDESRFTLDFHDGRVRVHRLPNERFAPCCIAEHDRYGGGSVMVWAGIWHGGRTALITISGTLNAQKYRDDIVVPIVIPLAAERNLTFQDDNAKPHRGHSVTSVVRESRIPILPWPSRSPDLSPIEHVWDQLGRKLRTSYPHPPTSLSSLTERLVEQWNLLDQADLDKLCDSMPNRIKTCLAMRGGHTPY